MNPHFVATLVFACVFATTLLGMHLSAALPKQNLWYVGSPSKSAVAALLCHRSPNLRGPRWR